MEFANHVDRTNMDTLTSVLLVMISVLDNAKLEHIVFLVLMAKQLTLIVNHAKPFHVSPEAT